MYKSLEEICTCAKEKHLQFWEVILENDVKERAISEEESKRQILSMYEAMQHADAAYDAGLKSTSGLVGTDGDKIHKRRMSRELISGDFIGMIMEKAVMMGESNACMKRIVAAPTAGSCGVVPAVLISMQQEKGYSQEQMMQALYVAAGIGGVIADRASISGAAGGCQAEIGSASSMAAGAAAFLQGADAETICEASALALKNLLGLACDPVAGLVEVPCVKRNVIGAVNAVTSCDLALAGIKSRIPPDEVIDAMRQIGQAMPESLRETGKGGLAATKTGMRITEQLQGETSI